MNISKHDLISIDFNQAVVVLKTAILLYVVIGLLYLFYSTEAGITYYIIKLQSAKQCLIFVFRVSGSVFKVFVVIAVK